MQHVWEEEKPLFHRFRQFHEQRPFLLWTIMVLVGGTIIFVIFDRYFEPPPFLKSIMRVIRAFVIVSLIIADYKWSLNGLVDEERAKTTKMVNKRCAERLLRLCLKNGGIYVKAGQHIAALNQILPVEYTSTMTPVQDQAEKVCCSLFNRVLIFTKRPFKEIAKMIQQELGKPLDLLFRTLNPEPIAAGLFLNCQVIFFLASLAQVYDATLHNGDRVALKVQYPDLRATTGNDIKIFSMLIAMAEWFFKDLRLQWVVDEFRINVPSELDFINEGKNSEKLMSIIAPMFSNVRTPKVYWDFTTSRVLTLEFIDGVKVNDVKGML